VRDPVVCHGDPISRTVGLDVHGFNVAGDIGHEHKVEVVEATHGEAQATSFDARNSTTCMIFDNYSNKLNIYIYIHMAKLLEGLWLQMYPQNFQKLVLTSRFSSLMHPGDKISAPASIPN
jgi:hypothetical protein